MDMDKQTQYLAGLTVVLSIIIIVICVQLCSVKVYRFSRPSCGYCKKSQFEWNKFKRSAYFRMIKPIDIDMHDTRHKHLISNFNVTGVPTVIAVYGDGTRVEHAGDRTSDGYHQWLGSV